MFTDETRKNILEGRLLEGGRREGKTEELIQSVFTAAHEISRVQSKLAADPVISEILQAFDLSEMLNERWPTMLSQGVLHLLGATREPGSMPLDAILHETRFKWRTLMSPTNALKSLLIPKVVQAEKPFDEILTIEIRSESDETSASENIAAMLVNLREIYESVAKAMRAEHVPLTMIYATSGTSFRFDFKGLASVIKEVKNLIVELWRRFRFQRAEEQQANNKAVVENLKILEIIAAQEREKTLTAEESAGLREVILRKTQSFFDTGAVPREIPRTEVIENQVLLEARQPKLLTTAVSPTPSATEPKRSVTKRKRRVTPGSSEHNNG